MPHRTVSGLLGPAFGVVVHRVNGWYDESNGVNQCRWFGSAVRLGWLPHRAQNRVQIAFDHFTQFVQR